MLTWTIVEVDVNLEEVLAEIARMRSDLLQAFRGMDREARGVEAMREGGARLFELERSEDVSGVSGTGTVAEGIEFSDGTVALRWIVGEHRSTVIWPSMAAVEAVHGHDGRTSVVWR